MFGFPKVNPAIKDSFKRNFLRNVTFQIKFENTEKLFEHKSRIHSKFETKYPRLNDSVSNQLEIQINNHETPIINTTKGKGFVLKSSDGNRTINFSTNQIDININGIGYKNFQDILNFEIQIIQNLLIDFEISVVNRIAIRKINIIGLGINDNTNLTQISKELLNERISYSLDSFPMEEKINQNINNINYLDGSDGLNLKLGHTLQPNNPKVGHIICDIDRYNSATNNTENIKTIFETINDEIFEIFIWFLNAKSIYILTT